MSRDLRPYAQWPKPKSQVSAPVVSLGAVVIDADGDWAYTDDPDVTPDGWLVVDAQGGMSIEDTDPTGALRIRMGPTETLAY